MQSRATLLLKDRIAHHRMSFVLVLVSIVLLIASSFYALYDGESLAGWEIAAFQAVNNLPDWLTPFFVWMTNAGTIGAVIIAGFIALIAKYRRIGLAILFSGGLAWLTSHILKDVIDRARPDGFIEEILLRYTSLAHGYGFPSGHAAVGAACAMAVALIVPRKYTPWLIALGLSVGLSRVYLGVHLPLDVIAGWCIGIIAGFVANFALGVERSVAKG